MFSGVWDDTLGPMSENLSTAEILNWHLDAGIDETIGETPVNRFAEISEKPPEKAVETPPPAVAAKPSEALEFQCFLICPPCERNGWVLMPFQRPSNYRMQAQSWTSF